MKTLKKTLCLVLAVVMVVGVLILPAYAADDYDDAIEALQNYGVLQGYPDGGLHTDANITRGQMAAIIYRIMTGDTSSTNDEVTVKYGNYANKFSDANTALWAKGYIGFCANKGVLKGYDTGAIQPNKLINGYEVRAMLLRALGYDKNNEYTGNDWQKYVLSDATQSGISKGVNDYDPADVTPRGAVAQLTYNATNADMVAPTVYPNVSYKSIGKKLITVGEAGDPKVNDFGVPTTTTPIYFNWPDDPVESSYSYTPELLGRWYAPVVECDVATAAKIKTDTEFTTYTNGSKNEDSVIINPTDERATIGDYGRETSVYDGGLIIYKDVVLAKIKSVTPAVTDNAGHTVKDASYTVDVYYGAVDSAEQKGFLEQPSTAILGESSKLTFAKGDIIRAYCVTDTGTMTKDTEFSKLVDAVKATPTQVAVNAIIESATEGSQTGFKGTNNTTYMYSNTYCYTGADLVDAGAKVVTLQDTNIGSAWGVYTDGHNNVLSLVPEATVSGYGVVTKLDSEKISLDEYAAKLTILTSDNNSITVQVLKSSNDYFSGDAEILSELTDVKAGVLVKYEANTDKAGFTKVTAVTDEGTSGTFKAGEVKAIDTTKLVNDDTVFFIAQYANKASAGGYTANGYKIVKGFKNIKDLSHDSNEKVDNEEVELKAFYVDEKSDGWADYVLINGATTVSDNEKVSVDNYAFLVAEGGMVERNETYDLYKAIINGSATTLKLQSKVSTVVTKNGLYTYKDRNTNGAYGDVTDVEASNKVTETIASSLYNSGALKVTASDYKAVADDVKIYFVNPDTGTSVASKYDLETVLSSFGADGIEAIYFQTDEYEFIDLLYVVSKADATAPSGKEITAITISADDEAKGGAGLPISGAKLKVETTDSGLATITTKWQRLLKSTGVTWVNCGTDEVFNFDAYSYRVIVTVEPNKGCTIQSGLTITGTITMDGLTFRANPEIEEDDTVVYYDVTAA